MPLIDRAPFLDIVASSALDERDQINEDGYILVGQGACASCCEDTQPVSPRGNAHGESHLSCHDQNSTTSSAAFSIDLRSDGAFSPCALNEVTPTHNGGKASMIAGVISEDAVGNTYLAQGRAYDADHRTLLAFKSKGAQKDAYPGYAHFRSLSINNLSILRSERSPALRTAAFMEVSA